MGQPWGLTGPEFIGLYIGAYVMSLILVFGVIGPILRRRLGSRGMGEDVRLDAYHVAYLAKGPLRVASTAIVALAERGDVLVSRNGTFTSVADATVSNPIESAVYEDLAATGTRAGALAVIGRLPVVGAIRDELARRGLLLEGRRLLPYRLRLLLPIAVWITGLVRAINGGLAHRPIGILVTLLVFSGMVLVFVVGFELSIKRRRTRAGEAYLNDVWTAHNGGLGANVGRTDAESVDAVPVADSVYRTAWSPALVAVAAIGFTAVADDQLRDILVGLGSASSASGTGGSTSYTSYSSGSGGNSGCGGGSSGCGG